MPRSVVQSAARRSNSRRCEIRHVVPRKQRQGEQSLAVVAKVPIRNDVQGVGWATDRGVVRRRRAPAPRNARFNARIPRERVRAPATGSRVHSKIGVCRRMRDRDPASAESTRSPRRLARVLSTCRGCRCRAGGGSTQSRRSIPPTRRCSEGAPAGQPALFRAAI